MGSGASPPNRAATVAPSLRCCSSVGPASSTPQPQKRRWLTNSALGLRLGRSGPARCSAGYPPHDARSRIQLGVALVDERLPELVAVAPQVQLEREALFEPVRALHV